MAKTRRTASNVKRRRSAIHRPAYRALLVALKATRIRLGFTQVEVCQALGRPTSWLSKCELGERRLDPIDLQELANVYGVQLSELLPPLRRLTRL